MVMGRLASFVIAAAALAAVSGTRADVPQAPVLIVRTIPAAGGAKAPANPRPDDDTATALLLASLSPETRAHLVEQMAYTAARLEGRLSPVVEDLGDDAVEPIAEFRHDIAGIVPSLNAAQSLSLREWRMPGLAARVAASCAEGTVAPDEICSPLWRDGARDGELPKVVARARLLTWAVSQSVVVDLESVEVTEHMAGALRAKIGTSSLIALVLSTDDLALRPTPDREEIRASAVRLGRAMAASHIEEEHHLEGIGRTAPRGRALAWLSLTPSQLFVVPRLSAFGRPRENEAEIESAAGATRARWVRRP